MGSLGLSRRRLGGRRVAIAIIKYWAAGAGQQNAFPSITSVVTLSRTAS